jgi:hypothetical protein
MRSSLSSIHPNRRVRTYPVECGPSGKVGAPIWSDPSDQRDLIEVLESEGVVFTDGAANPEQRLASDDLIALTDD